MGVGDYLEEKVNREINIENVVVLMIGGEKDNGELC
jgi:hypothetical protein